MTGARLWLIGVLALGVVARLPLLLAPSRVEGGDEPLYVLIAESLLRGEGFAAAGDFRTVGYPIFLAAADVLPGPIAGNVHAIQHLLGLALAGLVFSLVLHRGGLPAAIAAGGIAAASPLILSLEHIVNADLLFAVLAVAAVAALVRGCEAAGARRIAWLASAGLLVGVSAHVKPAGQLLVAAAPAALAFATRDWRRTLGGTAVVVSAALIMLSPWIIRNALHYGHAGLSGSGQVTLFHRLFDVDERPVPTDEPYGFEIRRLQLQREADQRFYAEAVTYLARRGLSQSDLLRITGDLAEAAIREAPATYIANTVGLMPEPVLDLVRRPFHDRDPAFLDRRLAESLLPRAGAYQRFYKAGRAGVGIWLLLAVVGAAISLARGLTDHRSRLALVAYGAAWLALVSGTALTHGGIWRYSAAAAPLLLVALSGPAASFWRRPRLND